MFSALAVFAVGCGDDSSSSSSSGSLPDAGKGDGSSGASSSGSSGATSSGGSSGTSSGGTSSGGTSSGGTSGGTSSSGGTSGGVDAGPQSYSVGGTVTGLAGATGLTLQLNGASDLPVALDGAFAFPNKLPSGGTYAVTISKQPTGKTCNISAGNGSVTTSNVSNVVVNCAAGTFTVGGKVTGLGTGASVKLTNNGGNEITVSTNGTFAFANAIPTGQLYSVVVSSQPTAPLQTCTVTSGAGTIGTANVTSVAVDCVTSMFTVGGSVTGLNVGSSVVIQNNGGDNLTVSGNNPFTFATSVASGASYAVTVLTNPSAPAQTCTVASGTGSITNANVTNVAISCASAQYAVGGTLTGMNAGGSIVLQNNGGDDLTVGADGAFAFATKQNSGTNYAVTIKTQPAGQTCSVSAGTGAVGSADISSVVVNCSASTFTVGGSVTGLNGTVVLSNGTDTVNVTGTTFSFPTAITTGTAYTVAVKTNPDYVGGANPTPAQTCIVTANGTGTMGSANVTNVTVLCADNAYTVGGTIFGLTANESLTMQVNGGATFTATANAQGNTDAFVFSNSVKSNVVATVQNLTGPTGPTVSENCVITSGNNQTVTNTNISNIVINCAAKTFNVKANVTGIAGTGTFRNTPSNPSSGSQDLITNSNTVQVIQSVTSGQGYAVTVVQNPTPSPDQTCTVTNGTGNVVNSDVTADINCVTNKYTVGGTLSGLNNAGTNNVNLTLSGSGVSGSPVLLALAQNNTFTFQNGGGAAQVTSGTQFTVAVTTQPNNPPQTCFVNGLNSVQITMANANVTSLNVQCTNNSYPIGGQMSGLVGSVRLRNTVNNSTYTVSGNGQYSFDTLVGTGLTYNVIVDNAPNGQPQWTAAGTANQTCTVSNGSGTVTNAPITNIDVSCSTNSFTVGGTVSGWEAGSNVVLSTNGQNLTLTQNGTFTFPTALASDTVYNVTMPTNPSNGTPEIACAITSGSGRVQNGNVTSVQVTCARTTYSVSFSVSGLVTPGSSMVVQLNGANSTTVTNNGSNFAFAGNPTIANSSPNTYAVTVSTQPTNSDQVCKVFFGSGTMPKANVTNVQIRCGRTCLGIHNNSPGLLTGVYSVDPDGVGGNAAFNAYCDMSTNGGGWTLMAKANGNNATWTYGSANWTNATGFGDTTVVDGSEGKSAAWANQWFDTVWLRFFVPAPPGNPISGTARDQTVNASGGGNPNSSLQSMFGSGFVSFSSPVGRAAWEALIGPTASLQNNCNLEGFNTDPAGSILAKARIGFVANQETNCGSPDSFIGIGTTYGPACNVPNAPSVGDVAGNSCGPQDNGTQNTTAFGYLWIR